MTQPFDGRRECAVIGAENGVTSNKATISNPSLSNERPSEIYSGDLIESLFKTVEKVWTK